MKALSRFQLTVFSTYVEVILYTAYWQGWQEGILHVCGGDPALNTTPSKYDRYSPRMWRWSQSNKNSADFLAVFSTYVEVILNKEVRQENMHSILHVCGGDPKNGEREADFIRYSPRMWRWSYGTFWDFLAGVVFSTYVEVILHKTTSYYSRQGILHVCGGDPLTIYSSTSLGLYSPRMWRWSLELVKH